MCRFVRCCLKIVHGDLNRNYDYKMRLVFELPNGDITVYAFNTSIDSYASSGTSYWDFIDFSPIWKHILNQYNKIPAGIYKFYVYLDNTLLTTRNFTFK